MRLRIPLFTLTFLTYFLNSANIRGVELKPIVSTGKNSSQYVLQTRHFNVHFDSRGGKILRLEHRDSVNKLKDSINLAEDPFEFTAYFNPENQKDMRNAEFTLEPRPSKDYQELYAGTELSDGKKARLKVGKIFRFYDEYHYWQFSLEFVNTGREDIQIPEVYFLPILGIGPVEQSPDANSRTQQSFYAFYFANGKFETLRTSSGSSSFLGLGCSGSDDSSKTIRDSVDFFGKSSRFMNMTIQPMEKNNGLYYFPKSANSPQQLHLSQKGFSLKPGEKKEYHFWVYSGPKVKDYVDLSTKDFQKIPALSKIHDDLYKAFDFGFTGPIRDLIVVITELLYKLIPNYGVGIILFAILFKAIFWPLNQKQAESMKKMQILQPKLKEINEKYKDNPQEKQKRTMALYKDNKVNPLGGCLPILIQIPIFIALYTAYSDSYELWRSPFISGWIDDLSQPDTVYRFPEAMFLIGGLSLNILPIVMTLTQFLQTKFTTVSTDESQQKVMMFMPFILLFIFWTMPSGVVLYWTVTNILSVVQQLYTNAKTKIDS